jgi:hypothetical protein
MQLLVQFNGDPEDYHASSAERRILCPPACPNCGSVRRLRLHGYYARYVSSKSNGEPLLVLIRRLRCRDCSLTTSLLPFFCLTYRLVRGESVARFLRGEGIDACDLRWQALLSSSRKRYESWFPQIVASVGKAFRLPLEGLSARAGWHVIEGEFGSIEKATDRIVARCRITLLGRYSCHHPESASSDPEGDHTILLCSSGTDPPT